MSFRITIINHKGGLGKTTLAYHLAQILAERGARSLCVDADPQCNLSSLFLADKKLDEMLDRSSSPRGQTLWSMLGRGQEPKALVPDKKNTRVGLVVGDVELGAYEQVLGSAWAERGTAHALNVLTDFDRVISLAESRFRADFTIIDTAPSLGPLNRSIVVQSDFLVVPVGLDLFSVRGLKTLGVALGEWMREWSQILRFVPLSFFSRVEGPVVGGYVLQRVPNRKGRDYSASVARIQARVNEDLVQPFQAGDRRRGRGGEFALRLGEIPELSSLSEAQLKRVPVWSLDSRARAPFEFVSDRLLKRIGQMRGGRI